MRFLGRLLKFLFWVLLVSTVVKLLGRLVSASRTRRAPGGRAASAEPRKLLVKDPVCGMHMAEELALPLQADGDVLYFCSEGCRSKYEHSMVRRKVSA
jgi:YHS domain-containing protein